MKKKILVVAALQLFLMLGACSSDSGSDATTAEVKGEIKADYLVDVVLTSDFVIGNDNVTYKISEGTNGIELIKIDLEGNAILLNTLDFLKFNSSRLTMSNDGAVLLVVMNNSGDSDKIFRFENNFLELNPFYTMKPISSPFAKKIGLNSICNNNDNTYFVYDNNNKEIKRVIPSLSTDAFVAGSGKSEIKDGTGLDVGFGSVNQIISHDNVLYLIDNLNTGTVINSTIRKLEYVNNQWKVTTLISSTTDRYDEMAFDANNELYVLVDRKGIFKLNLQDNALTSFKEGGIKIGNKNSHISFDAGFCERMKIKGNDLYLISVNRLIKISDFQTKFANAAK
ncbi:hypothetical protein IUY40_13925 [Flavobacterium sp. ALJ2]|uniref:hypothetical protein n=1 Tax=Flavobacterium sp. ALJ2 TaxID=2786960 RepID=UPI0018A066A4|nr:hypothetical protein [Flavobacterium sp. ALJ2]MBF7092630.1 hypothetical protein [Flavobacterium sp. ALJ2]